jgi:Flp pilus assembly secretin CpaC
LSPSSQKIREDNIKDLKEWRKTSLNTLRVFDQNQGMHAILVDKAMLERDPAFEKSLLNKAKKQQDLVVMSYDSEGTTKVLYEPKIMLLSGCLLARAWAALIATSLLPF